nr:undecaprenyl/decaprenyl-phosphate alpha-N-acetylglucosaminyl 1-phosphate transferase [Pseudoclavibacter chungangensis]
MYIGFLGSLALGSYFPHLGLVYADPGRIWAIVGAATLIVGIGVLDDVVDLDWMTKLAGQIAAAFLLAWQGVAITSLPIGGLTVGSQWMSLVITVLAMVLVMNAVNFIDGLDGLVAGVAIIANGVFLVYSYLLSEFAGQTGRFTLAALLSAVVVGICLGFLPWNWNPSKMFMGDGGALLVGLLMATSAISVTGDVDPRTIRTAQLLPAFVPLIIPFAVLVVPLLDFSMAVIRRMLAGKSPFTADRKHLHHRLLDMGHSQRQAVLVFYAWSAVVSIGALLPFVVAQAWVPFAFVIVGGIVCTVVTLSPISQRKLAEKRAQRTVSTVDDTHDPLDQLGQEHADAQRRVVTARAGHGTGLTGSSRAEAEPVTGTAVGAHTGADTRAETDTRAEADTDVDEPAAEPCRDEPASAADGRIEAADEVTVADETDDVPGRRDPNAADDENHDGAAATRRGRARTPETAHRDEPEESR